MSESTLVKCHIVVNYMSWLICTSENYIFISDMTTQLDFFQLNYLDTDGITELNLYTDPGNEYGNVGYGLYEITVDPVIITSSIIIRRPYFLTLCEVEVYGGKLNDIYVMVSSRYLLIK